MGESYAKLIIQPIDLVRAFKVEFCLASIIKWLTKWHMENKLEYLNRAKYYIGLCDADYSPQLFFALRMYCIANKFMESGADKSCLLLDVVWEIMHGQKDKAIYKLVQVSYK